MRLLGPKKIVDDSSPTRISIGSIVEYEQHGAPMLGVVVGEKKDKWTVVNSRAAQVDFPSTRLYLLPGSAPETARDNQARAQYLETLQVQAADMAAAVNLEELWTILSEESREIPLSELLDLAFPNAGLVEHAAMRRAMLDDQIYFKRKKIGFEPRPPETVESLKVQAQIEKKRQNERKALIDALVSRIKGVDTPLPSNVRIIEQYAALGKSAEFAKEALEAVEEVIEKSGLQSNGKAHERAFQLLVTAKHFKPDENLTLIRLGREARFSDAVMRAAEELAARGAPSLEGRQDLRELFTITIDSEGTRDCDDALSLEQLEEGFRIGIHIADVAAFLPVDSPVTNEAMGRATSIYTADAHIPMLPPTLSENALSLLEGRERGVMSFFIEVDSSYQVRRRSIARSVIQVKRRMTYDQVDKLLFDEGADGDLKKMLFGLWDATCVFEERRLKAGASGFSRREMNAVLKEDGTVALEEVGEDTPAHKLVSEMMILANETAALFGAENNLPLVYRSQEAPDVNPQEQGLEIPAGPARDFYQRSFLKRSVTGVKPGSHYGLGLKAYIQATSPIRRASDLINQRQISNFLVHGAPLFEPDRTTELIASLEPGLDEAIQVQRDRNRYFLLKYLVQEDIRKLDAIVMKTDGPKPLAELDMIFMITIFYAATDMKNPEVARRRRGERIQLSIDSIDPRNDQLVLREVPPDQRGGD